MARALQEFDIGIAVPDVGQPLQPYLDLAWAGLGDAPIFQTTDLLTPIDRLLIQYRYASEMMNGNCGGQDYIGKSCE